MIFALAFPGQFWKQAGAMVWRKQNDAQRFLEDTQLTDVMQVYGVIADWERDTAPSTFGDFHDLLIDAHLIQLTAEAFT